jgi:hypothetical protein
MDVNGYSKRIREAVEFQASNDGKKFTQVEEIRLSALQTAFKTHSSWSDINNNSSDFVRFLTDACPCEQDEHKY